MNIPVISVIVPVWNSMPYVIRTVEGILAQTFQDFEILIIDDKGPDDSIAHLRKYEQDPRVRIIDNITNRGFSGAMNHGLELARGEFIAAMDADDTPLPRRLEFQLAYMRKHPECGLVGSATVHITPDDKIIAPHRQPLSDHAARFQQYFMPSFYHPSTMVRRNVVEQHHLRYNGTIPLADDFDFWNQVGRHAAVGNIAEPLVYYRVHPNSLSKLKKDECNARKLVAIEKSLRDLGLPELSITRVKNVIPLLIGEQPVSVQDMQELWLGLTETLAAFCAKEKLSRAPWMLKATIGKWMIKTILYTPSSAFRLKELWEFTLRHPDYALAGALNIADLLLWQAQWRWKLRHATP